MFGSLAKRLFGSANDRFVKDFLASVQLAYRKGPEKPVVVKVETPDHPVLRQIKETIVEKAAPLEPVTGTMAALRPMIDEAAEVRQHFRPERGASQRCDPPHELKSTTQP